VVAAGARPVPLRDAPWPVAVLTILLCAAVVPLAGGLGELSL
jgi:hypothetical protein